MNYKDQLNSIYDQINDKFTIISQSLHWNFGYILMVKSKSSNRIYKLKLYLDILKHKLLISSLYKELVLMHLTKKSNFKEIEYIIKSSDLNFKHLCLVQDPYVTDLKSILKSKQDLTKNHVVFFTYCILIELGSLHSLNVVHRNLNPENIIVNCSEDFRIINYELSCRLNSRFVPEFPEGFNDYCRIAPEVLENCPNLYLQSDIWTLGCLIVDLLTRKPFFSGDCKESVISSILKVFKDDILRRSCIEKALEKYGQDSVNLVEKMLRLDPSERPSVEDILKHQFFAELFDNQDILNYKKEGLGNDMDFEDWGYSKIKHFVSEKVDEINFVNEKLYLSI